MQCLKQDGSPVLHTVQMAHTFWTRFRGLLGRTGLDSDEGLLIVPCNSVHTLGMKFAIGVVFLTRDGKVCHLDAVKAQSDEDRERKGEFDQR